MTFASYMPEDDAKHGLKQAAPLVVRSGPLQRVGRRSPTR
jgi:hypothetical protein